MAGDGAYYFDPYCEDSIKNAIIKVIGDEEVRSDLIHKGSERLNKFSWKQTAEETKKVYESILV